MQIAHRLCQQCRAALTVTGKVKHFPPVFILSIQRACSLNIKSSAVVTINRKITLCDEKGEIIYKLAAIIVSVEHTKL